MKTALALADIDHFATSADTKSGHLVARVALQEPDGSTLTIEAATHDEAERFVTAARALVDELDHANCVLRDIDRYEASA